MQGALLAMHPPCGQRCGVQGSLVAEPRTLHQPHRKFWNMGAGGRVAVSCMHSPARALTKGVTALYRQRLQGRLGHASPAPSTAARLAANPAAHTLVRCGAKAAALRRANLQRASATSNSGSGGSQGAQQEVVEEAVEAVEQLLDEVARADQAEGVRGASASSSSSGTGSAAADGEPSVAAVGAAVSAVEKAVQVKAEAKLQSQPFGGRSSSGSGGGSGAGGALGQLLRDAGADSGSASAEAAPALDVPYQLHSWRWRGHRINFASAGCGAPIVLVHGFGASVGHYRKNIPVLARAGYKVYALDLLGFGASEKPRLDYCMELWRDLVADFLAEHVQEPAVLVGNSIGSLVCLMVAAQAQAQQRVRATALLNCAGGMNNKAVADDWRLKLAMPVLLLIDLLLSRPNIARALFDRFRQKDNLRNILLTVYSNPEAVDEALIELLHVPSCDDGALEAFVSMLTGPPGPRPEELMPQVECPILLLWGDRDTLTPLNGPVGRFFRELPEKRPDTQFTMLPGVGHCPHDDVPEAVHEVLLPWLEQRRAAAA